MRVIVYKANREIKRGELIGFRMDSTVESTGLLFAVVRVDGGSWAGINLDDYSTQIRAETAPQLPVSFVEVTSTVHRLELENQRLREVLEEFPGHITEQQWRKWMLERGRALGRPEPVTGMILRKCDVCGSAIDDDAEALGGLCCKCDTEKNK